MLNYFDVVYVGLFSGMALLEDMTFQSSDFSLGTSYDELIDTNSGKTFVSEEARRLSSPAYYRDFGYATRFRSLSGSLVGVIAGTRDTGLRGLAPLMTETELPDALKEVGDHESFEVLYQITGQQGADLSSRPVIIRQRP